MEKFVRRHVSYNWKFLMNYSNIVVFTSKFIFKKFYECYWRATEKMMNLNISSSTNRNNNTQYEKFQSVLRELYKTFQTSFREVWLAPSLDVKLYNQQIRSSNLVTMNKLYVPQSTHKWSVVFAYRASNAYWRSVNHGLIRSVIIPPIYNC